ncbi:MAG: lysylphosphatidylglycerol synthase domain-containing protein [Haliscomenobacter sp.]|uniref:lysylphosphatidylglycerol synthase domain-containing protein n=1 Tax=Haliscomenobacter sp. TaxID=2717303 RepID=UPI0029A1CF70|nr:lysylphosphatidylglycerol synthase domain-containing protein [Haliscomenobacter sp.]MDX2072095.1 lysylphosphatidylglycerol synthase domain-containing protein [Haliscomenobacter sp.]
MLKANQKISIGWVLFRYLLALAIIWGLYTELFHRNNFDQLWGLFRQNLSGTALGYLLFCSFLMPFNWLIETFKWRAFTQPWSGMPFRQSWHAVLAGVAASMLLPNRSGDYLGRWLLAPKGQKTQIMLATIASNYCQFLVLLGMGFPSLLWLGYYTKSWPIAQPGLFLSFIIGLFICLLLLGVVVIPRLLHHYADRIRGETWQGFFKFLQMPLQQGLDITERYSWRVFAAGFGFACLRYGLYSVQYYAILRFYGILLPLDAALAGVGSIYLLQTAIPLPPVLALLARGEIALMIWGIWGGNALSILAASYTLFVLNLALPALLGLFYIVKKW